MKRILALILCIALSMLALVSCTEGDVNTLEKLDGKTPEELYEVAQEKLKEAKSYYVKSTQEIVMSMTIGDQTQTVNMSQLVESKLDGDNYYLKTKNENPWGENLDIEAWYIDGVVYYDAFGGEKFKASISKEDYMENYLKVDPSESTLLDIPESWFENINFEKEGDLWVLKFVVSGEKFSEVYENAGMEGSVISGDVDYRMYFDKDGNIQKLVNSFDMEISGFTAHCDSVSLITIEEVEVTAPANASEFKELNVNLG